MKLHAYMYTNMYKLCFKSHLQATREREDLQFVDPSDRQLQREINTEKFTVLVSCLYLNMFVLLPFYIYEGGVGVCASLVCLCMDLKSNDDIINVQITLVQDRLSFSRNYENYVLLLLKKQEVESLQIEYAA